MNNKVLILPIILIFQLLHVNAQEETIKVHFIENTPKIDGVLDTDLKSFQKKDFNYIWQFDNPPTDTVKVQYVIGYTPTHFYLYIETKADSINYRNRGFQNGDGFKLLLAIPQKDSLTNEFYELFYSPSNNKDYWARQRIWTYNIKAVLRGVSKNSKFEYASQNRKCGFEALISWNDIPPYHPWMLKEIGFNLYFAKAIRDTITNGYAVVHDYGIWDEGVKRKFAPLSFDEPKTVDESIILVKPKNRTLHFKEPLLLKTSTISDKSKKEAILVAIINDSSESIYKEEFKINADTQLKKDSIRLESNKLESGKYKLIITSLKDTITSTIITVLPNLDFEQIHNRISENSNSLSKGIINTLIFKLNVIQSELKEIKQYENGEELLSKINSFNKEYEEFQKGIDPYKGIIKPHRRAFKSKYDGTYQPYTVNLPDNYDSTQTYPLLVFLHGSGVDEQGLLNSPRSNGEFIEIAPFARDMYGCYSSDSSQNDILEAIKDVSENFSVDTTQIVIGGFSMGGYGALRTFYEHPKLYKGVAIFAGHPHLASDWFEDEHPNFLEDKYLKVFKGSSVFIYHGKKDGSLPVGLIKEMSEKMKDMGAEVTMSLVAKKGHEYPDNETNEKYFEWLNKIIEE